MAHAFADTFCFIALLDGSDPDHARAAAASRDPSLEVVTTDLVLVEVANYLAETPGRRLFAAFRAGVRASNATVVDADVSLLADATDLYVQRPDKQWSLTDCVSFLVMQRRTMTDALTADHHFEQAGFVALLK